MTKEELLKKIDEATLREEMAVPIYAEHISTAVYWSGLHEDHINKIKKYLKTLHDDSVYHVKLFKKIRDIVEGIK